MKLSLIELFSGIGAQLRGLQNTGLFEITSVATSEVDKDAMLSYAVIHCSLSNQTIREYKNYPSRQEMIMYLNERRIGYDFEKCKSYDWGKLLGVELKKYYLACILSKNLGDISRIEHLPYADLVTYSFPCTDISVSGKQKGIIAGQTRSGLLYEALRLFKQMKEDNILPKYLLMENVKNLIGTKYISQFSEVMFFLEELGYNTEWQILNAAECGIPQNRERVFALSVRKDIFTAKTEFPKPFDNGLRLEDVLDLKVDKKYYYSQERTKDFINQLITDEKLKDYEI